MFNTDVPGDFVTGKLAKGASVEILVVMVGTEGTPPAFACCNGGALWSL